MEGKKQLGTFYRTRLEGVQEKGSSQPFSKYLGSELSQRLAPWWKGSARPGEIPGDGQVLLYLDPQLRRDSQTPLGSFRGDNEPLDESLGRINIQKTSSNLTGLEERDGEAETTLATEGNLELRSFKPELVPDLRPSTLTSPNEPVKHLHLKLLFKKKPGQKLR